MTERLKAIWKHVDRIGDPNLADAIEASLVDDYLEENCYIIPEEDWEEIQTRGYDINMMCADADETHEDDTGWVETVCDSLFDHTEQTSKQLTEFWRGYSAGTEIFDISIPALGIDGECLC